MGCKKHQAGVPQPPLPTLVSGSAAPVRPVPALFLVCPSCYLATSHRPPYLPPRSQPSPAFAQLITSFPPSPYLDRGFFFFLRRMIYLFIYLPCHAACGIFVPQPGIEPAPPEVEARSLNHWTTREFPRQGLFKQTVMSKGSRAHRPGFKSQSTNFQLADLASEVTSVSLSFFVCEMGLTTYIVHNV